jgi:hypothetical protein
MTSHFGCFRSGTVNERIARCGYRSRIATIKQPAACTPTTTASMTNHGPASGPATTVRTALGSVDQ